MSLILSRSSSFSPRQYRRDPDNVLWLRFNGSLRDDSGNGNDAAVFSGSNGFINDNIFGKVRNYGPGMDTALADVDFFDPVDYSFTLACWIKTPSTATQSVPIGTTNDGLNTLVHFMVNQFGAPGRLRFYVRKNGNTWGELVRQNAYPSSEWFHVAGVHTGTALLLYVDGKSIGETSIGAGDLSSPQYGFGIGANNSRGSLNNDFQGQLFDTRIYNRALTAQEILNVKAGRQP